MAYAVGSAICALLATALLHFLLVTTPRATQFFGWIMVLITIVAVVIPLSLVVEMQTKIATALLNLVIGLVITSLLNSMAAMSVRRVVGPGPRERVDPVGPVDPVDPADPAVPPRRQSPPPPTRQWDV